MKYLIYTLLFLLPEITYALTFNALESTQTITAAKTYTSSVTVQSNGRNIILSTSSTSGVIGLIVNGSNNVGISSSTPGTLFVVGGGTRVFAVNSTNGRISSGRNDQGVHELSLHDSANTTIRMTNDACSDPLTFEIALNGVNANIANACTGDFSMGTDNQNRLTLPTGNRYLRLAQHADCSTALPGQVGDICVQNSATRPIWIATTTAAQGFQPVSLAVE